MNEPRVAAVAFALLCTAGCGGLTSVSPTSPSTVTSAVPTVTATTTVTGAAQPTHAVGPDVPGGLTASQQQFSGTVGPIASYAAPCYEQQYACEKYGFTLANDGDAVEVTLAWQGGARAMLIQMYRTGGQLVHEDLAPQGGSPTITFRRTDLPGGPYELRVVNMEQNVAHPFSLSVTTWQ
jgi:hypothetical protein